MAAVRTRMVIEGAGVDVVLAAAERHAKEHRYRVVIAIVDSSGRLLALRRTEGSQAASDQVAIDKARTAAIFVRPSREIEQQVTDGRLGALALHGARALTGGVPLVAAGEVVGAIGTSGETPDEDEAVSLAGAAAEFATTTVPAFSFAAAQVALQAVADAATARGAAPVAAVVDAGGDLVSLWRPDAAQVASVGVATDKARTAAIFRRPSRDFERQASGGRPSALHLAGAVPLQGGMPIVVDDHVVGAVGVSGASSADEDQELAEIGQDAAERAASGEGVQDAVFISDQELQQRFHDGGLLVDAGRYKVDAGRRTAPGAVEYHAGVVDVMRVVQGRAKVITGGTLHSPREVAPGELRADFIDGGTAHELGEGDVLVVPSGVPHQFVDVSDPFLYFVTKVVA
ncbi:heme-binding protein [Geodermatophilus sp. SYSU D00691]